jgi:hypothetical protein
MARKIKNKKRCKLILTGLIAYAIIISITTTIYIGISDYNNDYLDNFDDIVNPFPDPPSGGNQTVPDTTGSGVFDAQVMLLSNVERGTQYNIHLFALPGQKAELFRDFSVYIYSNQPANYLIKVDGQTHASGSVIWMKKIELHSEYETMDVFVTLENKTGVSREFKFEKIVLLDSPWQTKDKDKDKQADEDVPDLIDPYVRMSRGELNEFIIKRVFADIVAVILAILFGLQLAALKADLRGIDRVM